MTSNAKIILDGILDLERKQTASSLSDSDFFQIFTAEQILKNYGLSYEEIESGIVDAQGGDGGIDAFYTFVNGVLVTEEAAFEQIRQNVLLHAIIIQSKTSTGFGEDAILKLESTTKDLLDISHDPADFDKVYNPKLIRAVTLFHNTFKTLLGKLPEIHLTYHYATKADEVHPNVQRKVESLQATVSRLFTPSKFTFHFNTAGNLLELARKSRIETLPLAVSETIQTQKGTVCLVTLKDYFGFIHDPDTGDLRGWLFEENVRDYEGKNIDVNKGIRKTLAEPRQTEDFWWLNNGITIVASKAPMAGKALALTDPKIVNGLQTSMEIFSNFRGKLEFNDNRRILVRVIDTDDERTRNDIIKATNSQSAIRPASLRAFDEIQYRIEQFFAANGLFYDRRKNFYKNLKKPKDQIISVTYLAQAVAAIMLQRPNDSRGRPTNLIKNDSTYNQVFNDRYPIQVFLECVLFVKAVDSFLLSQEAPAYVSGHEINVRFQVATFASAILSRHLKPSAKFVESKGLSAITNDGFARSVDEVWDLLQKRKDEMGVDEDRVAKSPDFDNLLKERIRQINDSKQWPF